MDPRAKSIEVEAAKCLYCGFCEAVCPTMGHGEHRGYGPRGRVVAALFAVRGKTLDTVVDALYTCLLCRACREVCPAKVDVADIVRNARALLAEGWRLG